MRNIRIVTDTSSDLFGLECVDFATAPMKIITAEREFVDDELLDTSEMVAYLDSYKGKSKSSCPNTEDWLAAFGDAEEIFCATITSGLSGSYNAACVAKSAYLEAHPERRVHVIDTLSAGPEVTLVAKKLEELIENDLSFDQIKDAITEYLKKTGLVFMLKSLKTFANNGRISPLVAKLVGIAGLSIVGRASDVGTLEPMHKCRGERRSLEAIVEHLSSMGVGAPKDGSTEPTAYRLSIGHCQNEPGAIALREMILSKLSHPSVKFEIEIHPFRGLCSFYAEKGGVLVGFEHL